MYTSVEPVNDTLSMSMCSEMEAPVTGPSPDKMLITPGGNPAYKNDCHRDRIFLC